MPTNTWFVIPAHGRHELTRACLTALTWTIAHAKTNATAVVVASDENLRTADTLGLHILPQHNEPLGRKLNDGIAYAAAHGATHVIPFGTDDLLHPDWLNTIPATDTHIVARYTTAFVDETGAHLATIPAISRISGASGIRVIPTTLTEPAGHRPTDDNAPRGLDHTTNAHIYRHHRGRGSIRNLFHYHENHAHEYVDFKSPNAQLNPYRNCVTSPLRETEDPWETLADYYPDDILEPIRHVYEGATP